MLSVSKYSAERESILNDDNQQRNVFSITIYSFKLSDYR